MIPARVPFHQEYEVVQQLTGKRSSIGSTASCVVFCVLSSICVFIFRAVVGISVVSTSLCLDPSIGARHRLRSAAAKGYGLRPQFA